jgi:hypothetical protein
LTAPADREHDEKESCQGEIDAKEMDQISADRFGYDTPQRGGAPLLYSLRARGVAP